MSVRSRARRLHLNAEINVVSLIDVILLLLLIFMITAPMMTGGIEIQMPEAQVQTIEARDAVLLEVDKSGNLFLDRNAISREKFENTIKAYLKGKDEVTIRIDARTESGILVKLLGTLGAAGVKTSVVTAAPEPVKSL